jgi:hypothetical protein
MNSAAEIRALVLTRDSGLATAFAEVSKEFGIDAQRSGNGGMPTELGVSKYEALLIDFETITQPVTVFNVLRQSPANRNAVVFAVVGNPDARQRARDQGATFLLERPLKGDAIRRVLQAAYGLMTKERRRYYRCAIDIAVQLVRDSGEEIECRTINISSNGIALSSPEPFVAGEKVHVSFLPPDAPSQIRTVGTVVWDDKHGKTGLSMECTTPRMQVELDAWLDSQFKQTVRRPN